MTFDANLYKVKALSMETCSVVCGWFYQNVCEFVDVENENYAEKHLYPTAAIHVNPYSICRNTGTKIKNQYLYEFDLVKMSNMGCEEIGIVVFDEYRKSYCIQKNANYLGKSRLVDNNIIEIIGNVVLSDIDAKTFQDYSDKEDAKYSGLKSATECRSKQHVNKLARQHLPR